MKEPIHIVEPDLELAKEFYRSFSSMQLDIYISSKDGTERYSVAGRPTIEKLEGGISSIPHCRLILVHETNLLNFFKNGEEKNKSKCCIFYSSVTGRRQTQKTDNGWEYWIYNGVSTKDTGISTKEAKELYDWAETCDENCIPATLKAPPSRTYLPALAILCQGYLAIAAEQIPGTEKWGPEEISGALDRMKWKEFAESGSWSQDLIDKLKLKKKRQEVQDIMWWLEPFGGKIPEKELLKEWQNNAPEDKSCISDSFDLLLSALNREEGHSITNKVVADAYVAIANRLEGVE